MNIIKGICLSIIKYDRNNKTVERSKSLQVSDNKRLCNMTELKSLTTLLQCEKSFYNVKFRITFIKNNSSNTYMKNLS